MKKIILAIAVIGLMVSCSDQAPSGNREVTQIVRVKLSNGDIDWVRLNSIELKVYLVGDTIRISRATHRIQADSAYEKAVIVSKIK